MILRILLAFVLLVPYLSHAAPRVLLDAATSRPTEFATPPVVSTEQGATTWRGPGEWKIPPQEGIFTLSFRFLGYQSTRQEDLLVLLSGGPDPVAAVRNINSSARLKSNGRHLISGKSGQYQKDHWHEVTMVYHSGKGMLTVTCDGVKKLDEVITSPGTRFAGLRFTKSAALSGLRVTAAPVPAPSPEEVRLSARRADLAARIDGMASTPVESGRQRAVLLYHLDQLDRALQQDALAEAAGIAEDITTGLALPMGRMEPDQVWLRPVAQPDNNPWLSAPTLETWFRDWLTATDENWKVSTPATEVYESIHGRRGTRDHAQAANEWMLLYSHPASPLRDREALLVRALRRIDTYLRDYHFHETLQENSHLNDFFALGPALMGAVMLRKTYPDLLLPNQAAIWQAAASKAAARYHLMKADGNYSNADLGNARIFIASALYTGNQADLAHGLKLARSWTDNIFPDGGSSYIARQNESQGYHAACIDIQLDNWLMTNDAALLDSIRRTEWYPLSVNDPNRIGEWFTAPSWKQSWYGAKAFSGHAAVWYLTGNPWYSALGDPARFDITEKPSMKLAMLYRSHAPAKRALPARFAWYDRNILGARMSNGRWSTAMNGRVTDQLVGKNTYVGLTIADPGPHPSPALDAALYGIMMYPVFPGQGTNTATGETIGLAMGHQLSSIGADYRLARRMAGPARRPLPWLGRQCWLMLPDRMLGYLEITPEEKATAHGITLHLELGRAKAGARRKDGIRKLSDREHAYGDLRVRVIESSLGPVVTRDTPDGLAADGVRGPHSEYHLVDPSSAMGWSAKPTARAKSEFALVELRMDGSPEAGKITRVAEGALIGVAATFPDATIISLYNSGKTPLPVQTARFGLAGPSSMLGNRPDFTVTRPVPPAFSLPAGHSVILVAGAADAWHQPAVIGVQAMLELMP